jgi:hypothetical protein
MTRRYLRQLLIERGFMVVFTAIFIFFSVVTPHFFQVSNILNIAHTMAPLAITAAGLALVVLSGRLDISDETVRYRSGSRSNPDRLLWGVPGCDQWCHCRWIKGQFADRHTGDDDYLQGSSPCLDGCVAGGIARTDPRTRERNARIHSCRYLCHVDRGGVCTFAS